MNELGPLSPLFRPSYDDTKENFTPRLGPAKRVPIKLEEATQEQIEEAVNDALEKQRVEYMSAIEQRDRNIEELIERQQVHSI
jgi:hypothetical protein